MSGRVAGLMVLLYCELLGGIGLRNAALELRSQAELRRRRIVEARCREQELRASISLYLSPAARLDRAAARARRLAKDHEPEL